MTKELITCVLCNTTHEEKFCPTCGYLDPESQGEKMTESPNFFVQKTLEGYESKIKLLEKEVDELGKIISNMMIGVQAAQFQTEAVMHLLIDKKQLITEEEARQAVAELYERVEATQRARESEDTSEINNELAN